MKRKELRIIQDSVVCCPYCKELFSVVVGWRFVDGEVKEITELKPSNYDYIPKHLRDKIKIENLQEK